MEVSLTWKLHCDDNVYLCFLTGTPMHSPLPQDIAYHVKEKKYVLHIFLKVGNFCLTNKNLSQCVCELSNHISVQVTVKYMTSFFHDAFIIKSIE